jgi:hypothetical protein
MSKIDQYAELFDMFHKAAQALKYPKITFVSTNGSKVQVYLAAKGYIAIKVDGEYQGKIMNKDSDLIFYPCQADLRTEIENFCSFPAYQSKIYGQRYNHCCFCGRELVESTSVSLGYGPICAENFGLPHHIPSVLSALDDPDF